MRFRSLGFGLLLTPVLSFAQDVVYVTNLNDAGVGSFRNAVAAAFSSDTVRVQVNGTVVLTSGPIAYNKDLVIEGPGMDAFIISGNDLVIPFMITGGSTWMSGLTIRDGLEPSGIPNSSGGMSFTGDTLYMRDVAVRECVMTGIGGNPRQGGGVRALAARARIYDCEFTGNYILPGPDDSGSAWGGGLWLYCDDILIRSSTFDGNTAHGQEDQGAGGSYGGAIYIRGAGRIENCTITGNLARTDTYHGSGPDVDGFAYGGGLFLEYGSAITVSGGSISGNATEVNADGDPYLFGGGVYARGAIVTIENCMINNNSMPPDLPSWILCQGGGVYASDVALIMRGCTLDGNASSDGSGLYYNGGNGVFALHHALLERTRILNGSGDLDRGAISATDADALRLTEVEMSGNEHRGLYTRSCDTLRVDRCLFSENGGGAHLLLMIGDNAFINSTFNGNVADEGAGIFAEQASHFRINNCTLVDDTLTGVLPLAEGREIHATSSTVTMRNTIMTSSVFQAVGVFDSGLTPAYSEGGNIARDNSAIGFLTQPTDLNNTNPQLGTFDDHGGFTRTWSLAVNSNSIDLGGPDTLSVDQRGFLRDGSADAGAFEYSGVDTQEIFLDGTGPDATVCEDQLLTVSVQATSSATIGYQWRLNGTDIPGANASVYSTTASVSDAGGYTCVLTTAGDTVIAGPILVTVEICTGIEQRTAGALRIWPVPAGDELWMELPPTDATTVIVRDQLGRVVLQQRIGSALLQHVDVAGWPAGLYAIELAGAGERAAVRFAKE